MVKSHSLDLSRKRGPGQKTPHGAPRGAAHPRQGCERIPPRMRARPTRDVRHALSGACYPRRRHGAGGAFTGAPFPSFFSLGTDNETKGGPAPPSNRAAKRWLIELSE